jgi:hypothetical protein
MDQLELVPRWKGDDGEDIFSRYNIFRKPNDLFAYCKIKYPRTMQMGAVFPVLYPEIEDGKVSRETDRQLIKDGVTSFKRPFVVDIDMDEKYYDRSGICACLGADMCAVCWDVCMHSARLIVDYLLRNVFKLRRIMHFWSGRRGIHIWCFDERAFEWTKAERVNVLAVLKRRDLCVHLLPEHLRQLLWPQFDEQVTTDPQHCTGLPLGPHHSTGAIRIMLPPLSFDHKFDPKKSLRAYHIDRIGLFDLSDPIRAMNKIMDE